MRVDVAKNYHGIVSVRDYKVKEALVSGEDLDIHHKGKILHIPNNEIRARAKPSKVVPISKYDGKPYRLIDFKWPRKKVIAEGQRSLFNNTEGG
jgi:hypothetical protein